MNAPTLLEIVVIEDKMTAMIEVINPPTGDGRAISVEDVEHALAGQKVVFGIDRECIQRVVREVVATGEALKKIAVAAGKPAIRGNDLTVESKVGEGAANEDARASHFVKAGQIVATKIPATQGTNGRNVLGEEIAAEAGVDREFSALENITVADDGTTFVATVYGEAKVTSDSILVEESVWISDDEMSADIVISPTLADNSALTLSDVLAALEHAGVVSGVKKDLLVGALVPGQGVQELRLAEATPAQSASAGEIAFKFQLNGQRPEIFDAKRKEKQFDERLIVKETVVGGDVLAVRSHLKSPVDGCTVTGKVLPGRTLDDKAIAVGSNVELLDDGLTYVVKADAIGYANFIDGTLFVEDAVQVSEDGLSVHICIQPPSASGKMLSREQAEKSLSRRGVKYGVDRAAIEQAIEKAATMAEPLWDVLVARGKAPRKGEDTRYKFEFQHEVLPGTLIEGTDRMNYKERHTLQTVQAGGVLAVEVPATPGEDGTDVFEKILPAAPGEDRKLDAGENVKISEDGLEYVAEIDGVISLLGEDKICVFQQYDISGDVDYSTGNLTMDGTLIIQGWIRSGFTVKATGDILVEGGIEDAVVEAGASLVVRGGIIGKESSRCSAVQNIHARFIEGGRVSAGGDINVAEYISRSVVSAEGRIDVTEAKGAVFGGSVTSAKGQVMNVLGSESGVKTLVEVGRNKKAKAYIKRSEDELIFYRRNKRKIAMALAPLARKFKQRKITATERRMLAKLVKASREASLKEAKLARYKKGLAQAGPGTGGEPVTVKIRRVVHEGTTVIVRGQRLYVREDIRQGGTFVLDKKDWTVKYFA